MHQGSTVNFLFFGRFTQLIDTFFSQIGNRALLLYLVFLLLANYISAVGVYPPLQPKHWPTYV